MADSEMSVRKLTEMEMDARQGQPPVPRRRRSARSFVAHRIYVPSFMNAPRGEEGRKCTDFNMHVDKTHRRTFPTWSYYTRSKKIIKQCNREYECEIRNLDYEPYDSDRRNFEEISLDESVSEGELEKETVAYGTTSK
ncbi:unnamed protein product [Cochlearia groenlandica]